MIAFGARRPRRPRTREQHLYEHRAKALLDEMLPRAPRHRSQPAHARRRLLFVTHNTVAADSFGGVEVYQDLIAAGLCEVYDVFFYYYDRLKSGSGLRRYVLFDAQGYNLRSSDVPDFDSHSTLWTSKTDQDFASILVDFAIDLVHFQHLIDHTVSLPLISRTLGIPNVYTLHDFYLVCHRFNLLDHENRYCEIAKRPKTETCNICLLEAEDRLQGSQDYRRGWMQEVLGALDVVISSTEGSLQVLRAVYPVVAAKLRSIVLTLPTPQAPLSTALVTAAITPKGSDLPLKVAFLGNFSSHKGAHLFLEVARQLSDEDVEFTIFGRVDPSLEATLKARAPINVKVVGSYKPGELNLSDQEVSLHLSNWPETYCITLSEAWAAGLVPIVTDTGALGERVQDGVTGFKVPVNGTGELLHLLMELIDDRDKVRTMRLNFTPTLWTNVADHLSELVPVYEELFAAHPLPGHRPGENKGGAEIDMEVLGYSSGSPRWDQPHHVRNGVLPSSSFLSLAPVTASQLRETGHNFHKGRARTMVASLTRHAQFGPYLALSSSRLDAFHPSLKRPLRVSGHIHSALSSNIGPRVLALRAVDDLILRRFNEVASPTMLDGVPALDIRFVSEPLSLELLEAQPYSVEVATLGARQIELVPLGFTLFGGATPAFVSNAARPGAVTPLTAMPNVRPRGGASLNLCELHDLEVVCLLSSSATYLVVRVSPTKLSSLPGGALTLRIDGCRAFAASFTAEGTGQSAARALEVGDRMVCAVWLSGLPAGEYTLSVQHERLEGEQDLRANAVVDPVGCHTLTYT